MLLPGDIMWYYISKVQQRMSVPKFADRMGYFSERREK